MGPRLETITGSAIFRAFDRAYQIVLVNLLFLLTLGVGLLLFSHMMALVILVLAIRAFDAPSEYSMVNTWIRLVRRHARSTLRLSIPFTLTTLLFAFDTLYFYLAMGERNHGSDTVFFVLFLMLFLWSVVAVVNGAFLYVFFPHLGRRATWKQAVLLPRFVPLETLVLLLGIALGAVWFYLSPMILTLFWPVLVIGLYHRLVHHKLERLMSPDSPPRRFDDVYLSPIAGSGGSPRLPHARPREEETR